MQERLDLGDGGRVEVRQCVAQPRPPQGAFAGIGAHQVGDQILCHVAGLLSARLRAQDMVGRYGGEDAARRREAELKAKGFAAQAEPLGDTRAQSWLDARLPANANRVAFAAIAPSKSVDCATLR